MNGLTYEQIQGWKKVVFAGLPVEVLDPMRGKDVLALRKTIQAWEIYPGVLYSAEAIVTRDRNDVKRADAVVAYFHEGDNSLGMCVEIGWANAWNIPVLVLFEKPNDKRAFHPFLQAMGNLVVCTSVMETRTMLLSMFNLEEK
jgi:nucleoside 2-deoxyribosyltransferase